MESGQEAPEGPTGCGDVRQRMSVRRSSAPAVKWADERRLLRYAMRAHLTYLGHPEQRLSLFQAAVGVVALSLATALGARAE